MYQYIDKILMRYVWGNPRGIVVNVMNCDIVVSEFELQPHYHIHFRANTFGKGINPLKPESLR